MRISLGYGSVRVVMKHSTLGSSILLTVLSGCGDGSVVGSTRTTPPVGASTGPAPAMGAADPTLPTTTPATSSAGGGASTTPTAGSTSQAGSMASTPSSAGAATSDPGGAGGATPAAGSAGATGGQEPPVTASGGATGPSTCDEAAGPYTIASTPIDAGIAPSSGGGGFFVDELAQVPVSVSPDGVIYLGFTADDAAIIASEAGLVTSIPTATLGGIAATNDGVAALLFDPVDEMWAAVKRFSADGQELFSTDLFHSPNLDDEGTKGEASTSRMGYLSETDEVIAYFGHTQRYDDGVRHQGGYLATVDASGGQNLLNGWFGSHNLDQRLWANGSNAFVIGLGDAYPIGIFYSTLSNNPRPEVIYRLAAAGNGTANGQLGGIVDLGDELILPFITNLSVSPDIDAGEWPDIDESVASQIRDAAANGTDMGLLRVPKTGDLPGGDVPTVWLAPEPADGARLESLHSARYGTGQLVLLLWAEASGGGGGGFGGGGSSRSWFTMVVDAAGGVCQPKTPLDAAYSVAAGDDIVVAPNGVVYWANAEGGALNLVTLTPP